MCPFIYQTFQKNHNTIDEDDLNYVKKFLNEKKENGKSYPFKKILKKQFGIKYKNIDLDFLKTTTNYIIQLIISFRNYIHFLKSSEERSDQYITPILNSIKPNLLIVIFEEIEGKIKIKPFPKGTNDTEKTEYMFMYKHGNQIEPIIYRYYVGKDKKE